MRKPPEDLGRNRPRIGAALVLLAFGGLGSSFVALSDGGVLKDVVAGGDVVIGLDLVTLPVAAAAAVATAVLAVVWVFASYEQYRLWSPVGPAVWIGVGVAQVAFRTIPVAAVFAFPVWLVVRRGRKWIDGQEERWLDDQRWVSESRRRLLAGDFSEVDVPDEGKVRPSVLEERRRQAAEEVFEEYPATRRAAIDKRRMEEGDPYR